MVFKKDMLLHGTIFSLKIAYGVFSLYVTNEADNNCRKSSILLILLSF